MRPLPLILALSISVLPAQEENSPEEPKKAAGIRDLLDGESDQIATPTTYRLKFDTASFEIDSKGNDLIL